MPLSAFAAGCRSASESFAATVAVSDELVVWEGLPHQNMERELFLEERAKPVRTLFDYAFYPTPLTLAPEDLAALKAQLASPRTYRAFGGEKACGGFHPDAAVEVRHGASLSYALLCFGCGDIELHVDSSASKYEMAELQALRDVLGKYRNSRPEQRQSGAKRE